MWCDCFLPSDGSWTSEWDIGCWIFWFLNKRGWFKPLFQCSIWPSDKTAPGDSDSPPKPPSVIITWKTSTQLDFVCCGWFGLARWFDFLFYWSGNPSTTKASPTPPSTRPSTTSKLINSSCWWWIIICWWVEGECLLRVCSSLHLCGLNWFWFYCGLIQFN